MRPRSDPWPSVSACASLTPAGSPASSIVDVSAEHIAMLDALAVGDAVRARAGMATLLLDVAAGTPDVVSGR